VSFDEVLAAFFSEFVKGGAQLWKGGNSFVDQAGTALAIEWRVRHTSTGLAQSSGVDHRRLANNICCDLPRILRHVSAGAAPHKTH
jgi:hypothetical protein